MNSHFLHLASTPSVLAEQKRYYGRTAVEEAAPPLDELGDAEREFIAARDSFYIASVTEAGWPYLQHRGGPAGFLRVVGPRTLAFADVTGNRQMLSTGNIQANDRVALFLMDYPQRSRLKILGHARVTPVVANPELAGQLKTPKGVRAERIVIIDVVGCDWNCPKYITPRYSLAEVQTLISPLQTRITQLEAALRAHGKGIPEPLAT
jgi:predicted pyridoxine 5'-phosphate oxidase superfamily flavin-nucleotide-binding protein